MATRPLRPHALVVIVIWGYDRGRPCLGCSQGAACLQSGLRAGQWSLFPRPRHPDPPVGCVPEPAAPSRVQAPFLRPRHLLRCCNRRHDGGEQPAADGEPCGWWGWPANGCRHHPTSAGHRPGAAFLDCLVIRQGLSVFRPRACRTPLSPLTARSRRSMWSLGSVRCWRSCTPRWAGTGCCAVQPVIQDTLLTPLLLLPCSHTTRVGGRSACTLLRGAA